MNKLIAIVVALSLTGCASMTHQQQKSVAVIIAGALILGAANKGQSQCKAPPGGYCVVPPGK